MKNIFLLLFTLILFSCADDIELDGDNPNNSDNPDDTEVELIGRWNFTLFASENPYDLNGDGEANRDIITETGCYQDDYMLLEADGTGRIFSFDYAEISGSVSDPSNPNSFSPTCIQQEEVSDITWTQSGSTVIITIGTDSFDFTLTGNVLSIVFPDGFVVSDTDDVNISLIEDLTQEYTKQ